MEERILTADIIEDFRKNLELQEKSTSTIEKYIRDVKAFSVYAENSAITKEKVIAYKKYLRNIDLFIVLTAHQVEYIKKKPPLRRLQMVVIRTQLQIRFYFNIFT